MGDAQVTSIEQVIEEYLLVVASGRSAQTHRVYRNALNLFVQMLLKKGLRPYESAANLTAKHLADFAQYLQNTPYYPLGRPRKSPGRDTPKTSGRLRSPSSVRSAMVAARRFLTYAHVMGSAPTLSPSALELAASNAPKIGKRIVNFPIEEAREVVSFVQTDAFAQALPHPTHGRLSPEDLHRLVLIRLRDRAIVLTLADTGLRVSELCRLKRKDINWRSRKAVIVGKGDKQAVIRFSRRSLAAIQGYLNERSILDGPTGNLGNNPIFCRHDPGAGRKIKPLGENGVRTIVAGIVAQRFPDEQELYITPHTFRHLFVTEVVQATGDIRQAQLMARHESISTTERYSHFAESELDQTYEEVFGKGK
jgi:site-specific recombinase XerD